MQFFSPAEMHEFFSLKLIDWKENEEIDFFPVVFSDQIALEKKQDPERSVSLSLSLSSSRADGEEKRRKRRKESDRGKKDRLQG